MTTYTGTQPVEPGLYVNTKNFRVTSMEDRGALPGAEGETYRRVPMIVMLAMAPLLGLAFVIFLPFIGFAMVAKLFGEKALETAGNAAEKMHLTRPRWMPSLAATRASKRTPSTEKSSDTDRDAS